MPQVFGKATLLKRMICPAIHFCFSAGLARPGGERNTNTEYRRLGHAEASVANDQTPRGRGPIRLHRVGHKGDDAHLIPGTVAELDGNPRLHVEIEPSLHCPDVFDIIPGNFGLLLH